MERIFSKESKKGFPKLNVSLHDVLALKTSEMRWQRIFSGEVLEYNTEAPDLARNPMSNDINVWCLELWRNETHRRQPSHGKTSSSSPKSQPVSAYLERQDIAKYRAPAEIVVRMNNTGWCQLAAGAHLGVVVLGTCATHATLPLKIVQGYVQQSRRYFSMSELEPSVYLK